METNHGWLLIIQHSDEEPRGMVFANKLDALEYLEKVNDGVESLDALLWAELSPELTDNAIALSLAAQTPGLREKFWAWVDDEDYLTQVRAISKAAETSPFKIVFLTEPEQPEEE